MFTSPNMGLTVWNLLSDLFSHVQLENNWIAVDGHNHTTGQGVQIPTGGIANGAITSSKIATGAVGSAQIAAGAIGPAQTSGGIDFLLTGLDASKPTPAASNDGAFYYGTDSNALYVSDGIVWHTVYGSRGSFSLATSQNTSSTSYTTLSTADQVTNILLPANGLIEVVYDAIWQESVLGAARAAIFLGSNQLKARAANINTGPLVQEAATQGNAAALDTPLGTIAIGLASGQTGPSQGVGTDVTTGQAIGGMGSNNASFYTGTANWLAAQMPVGGSCLIKAAAGTYTISVQFKASSGSVTVKNRNLWVRVIPAS